MTLHANCIVYRVIEIDPPDDEMPTTWKIANASVKSASTKQITLKNYFPGIYRTKFSPTAFGSFFFETPLQAIQHFLIEKQLEIEALRRRRANADAAIAWATAQEGMS